MFISRDSSRQSVIVPSWVTSQALTSPDSLYHWDTGVTRVQTRRFRTLQARMIAAGVPATLERDNRYAPGLWRLSFPVRDYRTAAAISDACRIGDPVARKYGRKA